MLDCATMPGTRKSRYGTLPVGIARILLNVSPKITIHRTGCAARVNSSLRSCRIFCNSTRQNVATRLGKRRQTPAPGSAEAPAGAAYAPDFTQTSLPELVSVERVPGEAAEDVLQRRAAAERGFQLVGAA